MLLDQSILFCEQPDLQCADQISKLVFKKQLIYASKFLKRVDGQDDQEFEVSSKLINYWAATGNKMLALGVKIPVPKEHTNDPEENRGYVQEFYAQADSKGRPALFALIEFRDSEAAKMAKSTDVSIYVPPSYTVASKSLTFKNPIMHVALTNYPVVNDLEEFTIKASYKPQQQEPQMDVKKLAKALNIDFAEADDDGKVGDMIVAAFKKLSTQQQQQQQQQPVKASNTSDDSEETPEFQIPAAVLSTVKSARVAQINDLLTKTKITKAVADELTEQYATVDVIKASMETEDGFDRVIASLSKMPAILNTDQQNSGPQEYTLSLSGPDMLDPKKNPVLAAVEADAASANS